GLPRLVPLDRLALLTGAGAGRGRARRRPRAPAHPGLGAAAPPPRLGVACHGSLGRLAPLADPLLHRDALLPDPVFLLLLRHDTPPYGCSGGRCSSRPAHGSPRHDDRSRRERRRDEPEDRDDPEDLGDLDELFFFVLLLLLSFLLPPDREPVVLVPPLRLLPLPSCALTVAHARRSASFSPTPRACWPSSMCRALRLCLLVCVGFVPRGMSGLPSEPNRSARAVPRAPRRGSDAGSDAGAAPLARR